MDFIKYLFIITIIFLTSYLGTIKSKKYILRVCELKQFKEALSIFKSKIMYTYDTIPNIFCDIARLLKGNISEIFFKASNEMVEQSAQYAWEYSIENVGNNLIKEDIEVLKTLGNMLGKTNKEGQIAEIELVQGFLNIQIEKAEKENNKNEKLYKKLGLLAGIAIGIVLL